MVGNDSPARVAAARDRLREPVTGFRSEYAAYLHQLRGDVATPLPMDWEYMDEPHEYGPAGGVSSTAGE